MAIILSVVFFSLMTTPWIQDVNCQEGGEKKGLDVSSSTVLPSGNEPVTTATESTTNSRGGKEGRKERRMRRIAMKRAKIPKPGS